MMNEKNILTVAPPNNVLVGAKQNPMPPQPQKMANPKLILNVQSDWGGQGVIRNNWVFNTFNLICAKRKAFIVQWVNTYPISGRDLCAASVLWLQRQFSSAQVANIKEINRCRNQFGGLKMIMDNDDLIWGFNEKMGGDKRHGIPLWNAACTSYTKQVQDASIEAMKCMDLLSFSTKYLGEYVKNELGISVPYEVIPNTVPWAYWGRNERKPITEKIEKPVVIYTGAPQHYNNQLQLTGDWNRSWIKWVKNSVNNGKIDFHCIGGLPFFLEPIKDKIHVYPWVDIFNLHLLIKNIAPDFCINPLYNCEFNKAKSDLKFVESCAAGMICVGTVFQKDEWKGPYEEIPIKISEDCSEDEIEGAIRNACKPEEFNRMLRYQYDWIEENGRYTEHPKFINHLVQVLS